MKEKFLNWGMNLIKKYYPNYKKAMSVLKEE